MFEHFAPHKHIITHREHHHRAWKSVVQCRIKCTEKSGQRAGRQVGEVPETTRGKCAETCIITRMKVHCNSTQTSSWKQKYHAIAVRISTHVSRHVFTHLRLHTSLRGSPRPARAEGRGSRYARVSQVVPGCTPLFIQRSPSPHRARITEDTRAYTMVQDIHTDALIKLCILSLRCERAWAPPS